MTKTFTYIGDLSTILDYARWRLDDTDPRATRDETGAPAPFLWDETYAALFNIAVSDQEAISRAARLICLKLSKEVTSFGQSNGIRVAWRDRRAALERLAVDILSEPPFDLTGASTAITVGKINRGNTDVWEHYSRITVFPTPPEPEV